MIDPTGHEVHGPDLEPPEREKETMYIFHKVKTEIPAKLRRNAAIFTSQEAMHQAFHEGDVLATLFPIALEGRVMTVQNFGMDDDMDMEPELQRVAQLIGGEYAGT